MKLGLLRSSIALWRRGVPERVAPAVFGFPHRGEFPELVCTAQLLLDYLLDLPTVGCLYWISLIKVFLSGREGEFVYSLSHLIKLN
jgi:hypothetical protein